MHKEIFLRTGIYGDGYARRNRPDFRSLAARGKPCSISQKQSQRSKSTRRIFGVVMNVEYHLGQLVKRDWCWSGESSITHKLFPRLLQAKYFNTDT